MPDLLSEADVTRRATWRLLNRTERPGQDDSWMEFGDDWHLTIEKRLFLLVPYEEASVDTDVAIDIAICRRASSLPTMKVGSFEFQGGSYTTSGKRGMRATVGQTVADTVDAIAVCLAPPRVFHTFEEVRTRPGDIAPERSGTSHIEGVGHHIS